MRPETPQCDDAMTTMVTSTRLAEAHLGRRWLAEDAKTAPPT
ncbi:hypothetical protein HMPREF9606_01403, partial [Cutibacterium acnes HL036PA3]